jgi:hypothetical protein
VLEIGRGEGGAVEPPGRLGVAEHRVRVGGEREDDRHAESAEHAGRDEGSDVGEPEMRDVERPVPGDRPRELELDLPSVLPLPGGREIRVRAVSQARDAGAAADRLLRQGVEARERRILERPRERHDLRDGRMGVERPRQAHEQRGEAAPVARAGAPEPGVEPALERHLRDAEIASAAAAGRRKRRGRASPPSLERQLGDHRREAAARGQRGERRDRARVPGALAEHPGGVCPALVRGDELVDDEASRAAAAARERVEDEQLRGRVGTTCGPREPPTPGVVDTSAPEGEG